MTSFLAYAAAAVAEIAGCYAFWAWLRLDRSPWWLVPGVLSLALFAYMLTLVQSEFAGRAYAAYGGVYIAASLSWLWLIEGTRQVIIGSLVPHILFAIFIWALARMMFSERPHIEEA